MTENCVRRSLALAGIAGACLLICGEASAQISGVQGIPNAAIPVIPNLSGIPVPGMQFGFPGQPILQQQQLPGQQLPQIPGQPGVNAGGQGGLPAPEFKAPPSRLESLYNSRLPVRLERRDVVIQTALPLDQFGYETFGQQPSNLNAQYPYPFLISQNGAPQDSYVLGPGDEVVVVLRGLEDQTYTQRVNRDGQIVLPKLTPIEAAGRTLGDFRTDVERRVAQTYISTNAFVSIGQLRQIQVLITGDVRSPGMRVLSALATPLEAIFASGGIAKTGTLRSVTLMRGNETRTIDLYSVLTEADGINLGALENGDRIFVPPLQNTVAVAGLVKHPGIFELTKGQRAIDVDGLIKLAGGYEIGGQYRLSRVSLQPDGSTQVAPVPNNAMVSDGEILLVDPERDLQTQTVELFGAVQLPNSYPLAAAPTLHRLIRSSADLKPNAYPSFALIARRDLASNTKTLIAVSLSKVLSGETDVPLQSEDIVNVFTNAEIRDLAGNVAQSVANTPTPPVPPPRNPPNQGARLPPGTATLPNTVATTPAQANQLGNPGLGNTPGIVLLPNGAQQGSGTGDLSAGFITAQPGALAGGAAFGAVGPQYPGQTVYPGQPGIAGQPVYPNQVPTPTSIALQQALNTINREIIQNNTRPPPGPGPDPVTLTARTLQISENLVTAVAAENLVWLYDEVKDPGPFLVASGTDLGELLQVAGGPLRTADLSAVEVTSTSINAGTGTSRTIRTDYKGTVADFKRVSLQPLDVVRFRPVFSDRQEGRVTITGEVRFPGTFDVKRGERLSEVLARAGGLTNEAYPLGAIFTRRSAAIAEGEANQREAKELEVALAAAAQRGSFTSNVSGAGIAGAAGAGGQNASDVVNKLIDELRTEPALGRITVTSDPAVLQVHPEQDIAMEGGDALYIPKRPSTVTVTGEVLNTGSFAYRNDLTVKDYIAMAGGTRETADEDRTFVVLPDGSARPVEESWLNFGSNNLIPPGSTIVIPVAVAPFNFLTTLANIAALTQITSQLAITAVSLKLLGH